MDVTEEYNGWPEYAKLVLAELKRHDSWLSSLDTQINNHIKHIEHRLTEIESCTQTIERISTDVTKLKTSVAEIKLEQKNNSNLNKILLIAFVGMIMSLLGNMLISMGGS